MTATLRRELAAHARTGLRGGEVGADGALRFTCEGSPALDAVRRAAGVRAARVEDGGLVLELDGPWLAQRVDALLADPRDGVPSADDAWERYVLVSEALPLGGTPDGAALATAARLDALARVLRFAGHVVCLDHGARHPLRSASELAAALDPSADARTHADRLARAQPDALARWHRLRDATDRALDEALRRYAIERDEPYGMGTHPELVRETLARLEEDARLEVDGAGALRLGGHVVRTADGALTPLADDVSALLYRWMHFHASRIVIFAAPHEADARERAALDALAIEELTLDRRAIVEAIEPPLEVSPGAAKLGWLAGALDAASERRYAEGPSDLAGRLGRALARAPLATGPTAAPEGPARALATVLATFPDAVLDVAEAHDPAPLARHLGALATAFRAYDEAGAEHGSLVALAARQRARSASLLGLDPGASA